MAEPSVDTPDSLPAVERRRHDIDRRHQSRGGRRWNDSAGWRTLRMAIGAAVYAAVQETDGRPSIARSAALAGLSENGLANVLNDLDDVKVSTLYRFAAAHGLVVHVIFGRVSTARAAALQ